MEKQTEKIKKFSGIIYVLLRIMFVVLIVVFFLELTAWTLTMAEIQPIFKLGSTTVYLPVFVSEESLGAIPFVREWVPINLLEEFLRTLFTIIAIRFALRLFKHLKENGSPFREEIVKDLKKLAIVLLIVGCATGAVGFLAAGIVWVLCLIFDYGCVLQAESDTTL